jgi:tetratricopeptide (TPR) repeat protein/predicted RNA-binding Zn-ribbon protein involved in translation (DUF1610 family)
MVSYCIECGAKLEHSFKFCPNCGFEISSSASLNEQMVTLVVVCSNCGDENSAGNTVCNSCGVKLGNSKIINAIGQPKIKSDEKIPNKNFKQTKSDKASKKNVNQTTTDAGKKLEGKSVLIIAASFLGIIFLIFIASGTIDLSSKSPIQADVNQQTQETGVDLNSLSKINELKSLIDKNPNDSNLILELANLRFDAGFFEEAAKNYQQYLSIQPKNPDARIDMAVCFYNLQQFDRAEAEVLEALKFSPKHQTGYLNLGVIYLAKQNMEKAKEWFNKAVELNPNSDIGKKAKSLLQSH